jgi:hypothetical protein
MVRKGLFADYRHFPGFSWLVTDLLPRQLYDELAKRKG